MNDEPRGSMTRESLIDRAKEILAEAYEEAAELVAAYLETHPSERLQTLCKEIDPDNWDALRKRVQRAQAARKVAREEGTSRTTLWPEQKKRAARQVLRSAPMARTWPAERQEAIGAVAGEPSAGAPRVTASMTKLRAPDVERVAWNKLSDSAAETLACIAVPAALGASHREIAERTGWSMHAIARRLDLLRREIVASASER